MPIADTIAESYLLRRGLRSDDRRGEVLRFCSRRARKGPDGEFECHPAMLVALRDVVTGDECGVTNVYLCRDGSDRLRDAKGKIVTGRAKSAAMMLSPFDDVTIGLVVCEGPETGLALLGCGLAPVWALGGAGFLKALPVLGGIECLTVAADTGKPGQDAAKDVADRWRAAGREVVIISPPAGDWADLEAHDANTP